MTSLFKSTKVRLANMIKANDGDDFTEDMTKRQSQLIKNDKTNAFLKKNIVDYLNLIQMNLIKICKSMEIYLII